MPILSNQQRKFCEEYVNNGNNGTQAYLKAYKTCKKEETAKASASRLLTNVNVTEYIEELRTALKKKAIMTAEERMIWLTGVVLGNVKEKVYYEGEESEREAYLNDKMKAMDMLNKMNGEYINKLELSNNQEKPFEVKITVVK